jgi:hypothetical protein
MTLGTEEHSPEKATVANTGPGDRGPVPIFEQQPNESNKAFAAFVLYLSLGPERSMATVAKKLSKSEQLLKRWSAKFDWPARVAAHAAYLAIVEREAQAALARGKSVEWGKRQQQLRETEWEMHEKCIAAARRALTAFLEREKVYANLADISRILEVASKLGRLASGMATDKTELSGEDGGPIRVELSAALNKIYGDGGKPQRRGGTEKAVDVEVVGGTPATAGETPALPAEI